jgi:NADH dehydrogenase FAD-containing subunit
MVGIGIIGVLYDKLYNLFITAPQNKKTIVVVGYGWGGKAFCDTINHKKYDVTVLSKTDYMLNTPKLKDNINTFNSQNLYIDRNDIEGKKTRPFKLIQEEVKDISTLSKNYDYVVLAPGSVPNDFGVPGVKEHCHFLKTVEDLADLKSDLGWPNIFYKPHVENVIIAGAGPAGIELAFAISRNRDVVLVEAMPTILSNFSESTRNIIMEELQKNRITLLLDKRITRITQDKIIFHGNNLPTYLPYELIIWNCGVKANPLISELTDKRSLTVDGHLHYKDNIYGLGDIIASQKHGPPTAQNARQQGQYLARLFNNDFEGADYVYQEKGKIIHTRDNILIEIEGRTYVIPRFFEPLVDLFVDWVLLYKN